jgi:hypothetical protein
MTDVQVEGANPNTVFNVRVSKGRSGLTLPVESGKLAEYVYVNSLMEGITKNVNRGMSGIKQENYKTLQEFQAAIANKARQNVEAMYAGTLVIRGQAKAKDGVPTEVKTLARNMARTIVRAEAKKKGYKVSLIKPSVITQHANALLAARPELLQKAAAQIEQERQVSEESGGIDFGENPEDDELRAKAAQAKAAKQLSAAKAGKIAGRSRPQTN